MSATQTESEARAHNAGQAAAAYSLQCKKLQEQLSSATARADRAEAACKPFPGATVDQLSIGWFFEYQEVQRLITICEDEEDEPLTMEQADAFLQVLAANGYIRRALSGATPSIGWTSPAETERLREELKEAQAKLAGVARCVEISEQLMAAQGDKHPHIMNTESSTEE